MYSAKIITDSINPVGDRLTTFELTYPLIVHNEFMTHRLFSRNAASSRAIPIEKMIAQVQANPMMFKFWGKNQKGMSAKEELTGAALEKAKKHWLISRDLMVEQARILSADDIGLHKQNVNRLLGPWLFITTIMSATEFENWYFLRDDPEAQPEIAWLAGEMRKCHAASTPTTLSMGEWHLPYIELEDEASPLYVDCAEMAIEANIQIADPLMVAKYLRKIATARCARVSYLTHAGKREYKEDVKLHDRLTQSRHWSPFEHVAQSMNASKFFGGNFVGWKQYRKTFEYEHAGRKLPSD